MQNARNLMEKIQALPAERIAEIEDSVEFITAREQRWPLIRAAMQTSSAGFAAIWDSPEDAVYDTL